MSASRKRTTRAKGGSDVLRARYRRVYPKVWLQPAMVQLTTIGKLVALFLQTGPQSNRVGLYHLSPASAAETLNISLDEFRAGLNEACEAFGMEYDSAARVIWIPTWWADNVPENPNVLLGNLKDLLEVPPTPLLERFEGNLVGLPPTMHETFAEGIGKVLGRDVKRSPDVIPNVAATILESGTGIRNRKQEQGSEAARERRALARDAFNLYAERWCSAYGHQPDSPGIAQFSELESHIAEFGLEGVRNAVEAFFDSDETYVVEAKHPLGLLVRQFHRWAA
jgi:hypothetical protein